MILAKVTGKIWATIKSPSLEGYKFLIARTMDRKKPQNLVVADSLDAGIGETIVVTGGSSARVGEVRGELPIDGVVVAIVDEEKATLL